MFSSDLFLWIIFNDLTYCDCMKLYCMLLELLFSQDVALEFEMEKKDLIDIL